MSSENCDPCLSEGNTTAAIRYCYDCEERLCKDCHETHLRFKVLRSHHTINLKSFKSKPPTPEKYCNIHSETLLDFFCTQHDVTCCKGCIADSHRSCDKILPLDVASKDIKTSSLVKDSITEIKASIATLQQLIENRGDNITLLQRSISTITQQIDCRKTELIEHLDNLKQTLLAEAASIQKRNQSEIGEQKDQLVALEDALNKNKEDLEFLKEHGSNTQLFLYVRQTIDYIRKAEVEAEKLSSSSNEIDIDFQKEKDMNKMLLGSVSEVRKPCKIEFKSRTQSQAQAEVDTVKALTNFEVDGHVSLKSEQEYCITGIAVTPVNNLLVSNYSSMHPKVYMYKDCKHYYKEIVCSSPPFGISMIPGADRAVVTLPQNNSIQFINSTDLTKGDIVNVGIMCFGVFAEKDKIFVGGTEVVKILDVKGSYISTVNVGSARIRSLFYDREHAHILCRYQNIFKCCTLDGSEVYHHNHNVSDVNSEGLIVDGLGNTYLSYKTTHEIHRLSRDGKVSDVVLKDVGGLSYPTFLAFNNDFTKLFVVSNFYRRITIVECK